MFINDRNVGVKEGSVLADAWVTWRSFGISARKFDRGGGDISISSIGELGGINSGLYPGFYV